MSSTVRASSSPPKLDISRPPCVVNRSSLVSSVPSTYIWCVRYLFPLGIVAEATFIISGCWCKICCNNCCCFLLLLIAAANAAAEFDGMMLSLPPPPPPPPPPPTPPPPKAGSWVDLALSVHPPECLSYDGGLFS
uniref:Uncharacterized protein n=1 Tax=Glossina austeni TaxID=7395 RepID=A0A1A9V1I9_GLOAU